MIGLIKDVPGLNRARLNVPERSKVAVEMIGLRSAASQSADLESRTRTLPHRTLLGTAISSGFPSQAGAFATSVSRIGNANARCVKNISKPSELRRALAKGETLMF
jgi:hypothetical protein